MLVLDADLDLGFVLFCYILLFVSFAHILDLGLVIVSLVMVVVVVVGMPCGTMDGDGVERGIFLDELTVVV